MKKLLYSFILIILVFIVSGCGTFSLELDSKMTQSVFLKNLKPIKSIYLVKTNTASVDDNIASLTKNKLIAKNYSFVDDPDKATYILRVNTININAAKEQNEVDAAVVSGSTVGLVQLASKGNSSALKGGIVGATAGAILAYAVSDGLIRMQADVRITETIDGNEVEHKTRVIAEAKQVHLTPEKGQPLLEEKISKQIAGIFL